MFKLLERSRRPDISFSRKGIIRITARVARILYLQPGDVINITVNKGEYLLHATHHTKNIGRHEAQCYRTKQKSENYCANSIRLCRSLFDSTGVTGDKVAYMIGEPFVQDETTFIPIITQLPL